MNPINKSIVAEVKLCHRGKNCMLKDGSPNCNIMPSTPYEIDPIQELDPECQYRIKFAHKYYCTCGIRKEIYNNYNK